MKEEHGPCAFHDAFMGQIKDALVEIKDQMKQGLAALAEQSKNYQAALTSVMESQAQRRETCATQIQRIVTLESNQQLHRESHATAREEDVKERAELWTAINKLRFYVFIGLGLGLAFQLIIPLVIQWVKG